MTLSQHFLVIFRRTNSHLNISTLLTYKFTPHLETTFQFPVSLGLPVSWEYRSKLAFLLLSFVNSLPIRRKPYVSGAGCTTIEKHYEPFGRSSSLWLKFHRRLWAVWASWSRHSRSPFCCYFSKSLISRRKANSLTKRFQAALASSTCSFWVPLPIRSWQ